jgi:hypothetical protein
MSFQTPLQQKDKKAVSVKTHGFFTAPTTFQKSAYQKVIPVLSESLKNYTI